MWRVLSLTALVLVAGCQPPRRQGPRPDFLTRVQQDCAAGQSWACELLDALIRPPPADDPAIPAALAPPERNL